MSYDINTGYLLTGSGELELIECSFKNEAKMQETVEKSIRLLEKVFNTELLNCGKISLSSGSLEPDLVLISREGDGENTEYIPVIVELKRADSRENRRKVLAQLLEYMTTVYLEPQQVIEACQKKGLDFDAKNLEKNIEGHRIRGIILSDNISEKIKKTIELLNGELENLEIYGIELKRLCTSDKKHSVIIPVLIGATTEAEKKNKTSKTIFWTYEKLRQAYSDVENETLRNRLLDLLEWACKKNLLTEYQSNEPRFRIYHNIITVEPSGKLYVKFGKNQESKLPKHKRQELLEKLQKLNMLPKNIKDADSRADGAYTQRSITELSEEEFKQLKKVFENLFLNNKNK